jgi:D-glycero-D-manno-heptose 1,7-bisphosphate phosphatase
MKMNRAIFLDRDGTIIEEKGYICHLSESEIFPFAFDAVRRMNEHDFKVIVISNQSAVARGICTREQVETMHAEIRAAFLQRQAVIEKFYYCPYHVDGVIEAFKTNHPWRKPSTGMLLQAAADFHIDLRASYMVGDDVIDIRTGINAGCKTVLVLTGKGSQAREILKQKGIAPDFISENILTAINEIIGR